MKVVTPTQMQEMDRRTIQAGITSVDLMEKAGVACVSMILAAEAAGRLHKKLKYAKIIVLCGPGNNGGDGLVIARHLAQVAVNVTVCLTEAEDKLSPDNAANLKRLPRRDVELLVLAGDEADPLLDQLAEADLVIDAIFGTGLRDRPLSKKYETIIAAVNALGGADVIAIDIPSGLRGDNGQIVSDAIRADLTVIIQNYKVGELVGDGPDYLGEAVLVDIEISEAGVENEKYLLTAETVPKLSPRRKNSNKYDYGLINIVAGAPGMIGAGLLSATAALRAGGGLVRLHVPRSVYELTATKAADPLMVAAFDKPPKANDLSEKTGALVIGPGLGRTVNYSHFVTEALRTGTNPVIVDADGLWHLRDHLSVLEMDHAPVVLTPHLGEFSYLSGLSKEEILADPVAAGCDFAVKYQVVLVLKGYRTLIFSPQGKVYFNTSGNPGMATAGSGDVLSGIIAAFACQFEDLTQGVCAAVHVHGRAGDAYAKKYNEASLTATDLIDYLKAVL